MKEISQKTCSNKSQIPSLCNLKDQTFMRVMEQKEKGGCLKGLMVQLMSLAPLPSSEYFLRLTTTTVATFCDSLSLCFSSWRSWSEGAQLMYCLFESRRGRMFLELMLKHPEVSSSHPAPSFMENKARWSLSSWRIINDGGGGKTEQRARTKWAL